jgi:uncharacterized protein YukE
MRKVRPECAFVAVLALAAACDPPDPPARGNSREFAREVDEVNARNQELHERTQELDRRLTKLARQVEQLRTELARLSAQWARDSSLELDTRLDRARQRMSELRAVTGFDWQEMMSAAEEAIDQLARKYDQVSAEVEERKAS